ncbi:MAG TPA: hypothetical protein VFX03_12975, partial [Thermomicrobiales bacterium]|nr:hypothetical protein [Thermomicrobiales bacterium]
MDSARFDRLVAALARPASRRATVATLLGGALSGALDRSGSARRKPESRARQDAHAEAQPPPNKEAPATGDAHAAKRGSCPSGKKRCHGRC